MRRLPAENKNKVARLHRQVRRGTLVSAPRLIGIRLRQVIAERREQHGLGAAGHPAAGVAFGKAAITGPGIARNVGILRAELESAPRTGVELVPESQRAFDERAGVASTLTRAPGSEAVGGGGRQFGVASGVLNEGAPYPTLAFKNESRA